MKNRLALAASHLLAVAAVSCGRSPAPAAGPEAAAGGLRVQQVGDIVPALDPAHAAWQQAVPVLVPVMPQQMAMPRLETGSVESVEVRALCDAERIAFRLHWQDGSMDDLVEQSRFGDAVALQFPLDKDAPYFMGGGAMRVHILQWKALWQRDVDRGFLDVEDLRPHTWSDLYWFAAGERPFRVPGSFRDVRSHDWFPALVAGNAVAAWDRKEPVEELLAAGFGTSTNRKVGNTRARGVHRDGGWSVVFLRPLRTGDALDFQFGSNPHQQFCVAVWDGSAGNVGARKHFSVWVPFSFGAE